MVSLTGLFSFNWASLVLIMILLLSLLPPLLLSPRGVILHPSNSIIHSLVFVGNNIGHMLFLASTSPPAHQLASLDIPLIASSPLN